jgi:hypothetical protein
MFAANPSRPGATFFLIFVKDQSCDLRYYRISSPAEKSQLKRAAKWRPSLFRPNQDLSNRSGSLAIFTAIRRASSFVSSVAAVAWQTL